MPKRPILTLIASWGLILIGIAFCLLSFGPLILDEGWYFLKQLKSQQFLTNIKGRGSEQAEGAVRDSVFARLLSAKPILIDPVNKDFAIVIEKLGINAPIVANVSVSDSKAYTLALKSGIAHAINSEKPSKSPGNTYLFAHASLNFWELGKYATTFNLVRKLVPDDQILLFYKNSVYIYKVVNIERFRGWDTYPITRPVLEPILTLQTCDPPGTTLNRLVVTASLVDVYTME